MRKKLLTICMILLIIISIIPITSVKAASNILPTACDNLTIGLKQKSELVAINSGYMRVFYNGSKVCIEYYDDNFNIKSKKSIAMELNIWGGFFAGENAYYLVEGQNNTAENNKAEVIRVIKYDTNWKKLGTAKITSNASLFGGEVRYPFDYGCVEMTEHNGILYIVTGHEGYVDSAVGQGHQGFLMIKVDEKSMTGKIVDCDLWHSFAQYIDYKDSNLYVLEQSEGSRYTKLSKYDEQKLTQSSIPVLQYGGDRTSAWAIACYASVDDMALSSNNVLCLGTSIDQSKYDKVTSKTSHNIYLTVTPMNKFTESSTTVKWLTSYKDDGKSFLGTKITKINDNRFMISWEEANTSQTVSIDDTLSGSILHYIFVDGNGKKIGTEYKVAAPISDCHPIVKGSKVVFYASSDNMVNFYTIDSSNGKFSKKIYRVAGNNVTWQLKNGTLTFSGTGAISIDTEAKYRYPVSSTSGSYSYSSNDNTWKPIRDKVQKIVINKGITSIPANAFSYFNSLTEVKIEEGLKSIGKKAFYGCNALANITIPASVTSIGEDFLWTGYYWTFDNSHVVRATINAPASSYAIKYAKQKGINYKITDPLPFKDVADTAWYYDVVKYVYKNKIILGYTNKQFAPDDLLTRGQLVTILWRMENEPDASKLKNTFKDVTSGVYYSDAVKWAASKGIVKGYGKTSNFGPNDPIIRQDLAIILNRYAQYKGKNYKSSTSLKKFTDYKTVSDYATSSVQWAVENGVVNGNTLKNGKKTIAPLANATRAEAAGMITNYINKFNK